MLIDKNIEKFKWLLRFLWEKEIVYVYSEDKFYIFNIKPPDIYLPDKNLLNSLIQHKILDLDSGNYETGNRVYFVNRDVDKLKEIMLFLAQKVTINIDSFISISREQKLTELLN